MRWLFILNFQHGRQFWREPIGSFGEKRRASKLVRQAAEFAAKSSWNCLRIFSSTERRKRIQNNFSQARRKSKARQRGKESEVKGKEYGCRPVSE